MGVLLIGCTLFTYDVYFNYRFEEITADKVYKSGVIPPKKLGGFIKKYKIKSVIDFRDAEIYDARRPEIKRAISAESAVLSDIGNVNYFNIPSYQIPFDKQLRAFYEIMDNPDNYPVLMHCYHGKGRAVLYSALYRIEYEAFSNIDALNKTRELPVEYTSFAPEREKGNYLLAYTRRNLSSVMKETGEFRSQVVALP